MSDFVGVDRQDLLTVHAGAVSFDPVWIISIRPEGWLARLYVGGGTSLTNYVYLGAAWEVPENVLPGRVEHRDDRRRTFRGNMAAEQGMMV